MDEFLKNTTVQFVLALCTFLGGIASAIQFASYASADSASRPADTTEAAEETSQSIPAPDWVRNEANIIKKAFYLWLYSILTVLYSGQARKGTFVRLLKLVSPAAILFAGVGVASPYWLVCITFWIAIIAPMIVRLIRAPGPEGMFSLVIAYMPGIPLGFFIYYLPQWLIIAMYPVVIILAIWLLWLELVYKGTKSYAPPESS